MNDRNAQVEKLLRRHVGKPPGVKLETVRDRQDKPHATIVSVRKIRGEQFRIHYPLEIQEVFAYPARSARLLGEDAARVMWESLKNGELEQEAS